MNFVIDIVWSQHSSTAAVVAAGARNASTSVTMSPPATDFESKGSTHAKRRLSTGSIGTTTAPVHAYSSLTVGLIVDPLSTHHTDGLVACYKPMWAGIAGALVNGGQGFDIAIFIHDSVYNTDFASAVVPYTSNDPTKSASDIANHILQTFKKFYQEHLFKFLGASSLLSVF